MDYFIPEAFFGTTELSQINAQAYATLAKESLYTKTNRYLNYTGKIITVIERNGIAMEFNSIPCYQRAEFVIVTDWKIHRDLHTAFMDFIKHEKENETQVIRKLREILMKYQPSIYDEYMYLRTEECISLKDLASHRNEIYVNDHDVVVSLFQGQEAGPHPYSPAGRALEMAQGQPGDDKSFTESIKIVDSAGTYGDRFINRNKNVYRIEAVVDPSRQDGVWVIRNKPFENTRLPSTVGWRRYEFSEADGLLDLYKTYAEAEHCGDAEYKKKHELLALETRLTNDKIELADQKMQHQRQQVDWDIEKTRLLGNFERQQAAYADEAFRAKMELDRQKAQYERQMLDAKANYERRKESAEWMKQVPSILGALGVAWLSWKTAQAAAKR